MAFNNESEAAFNSHELHRRTNNAIRRGVIKESRYESKGYPGKDIPNWTNEDEFGNYRGPLYRVQFDEDDENKTYWMPQLVQRASGDSTYWAFEEGEQVIVLCVSGDPMQSFLLLALPQNEYRPPVGWDDPTSDGRPWRETVKRERFKDNTLFDYRRDDDKYFPGEARFIAAFLGAGDSFYQYEAKPDLRKLFIHIKEILIELDKTYTCLAEKDIICKAEEYVRHTAKIDITNDADENIRHTAKIDITSDADENIRHTAKKDITSDADENIRHTAKIDITNDADENIRHTAKKDIISDASKDIKHAANKNITFNAGRDVVIEGRNITIKADQKIEIKAGMQLILDAPLIEVKGLNIKIATEAGAKIELIGPLVKVEAVANVEINSIANVNVNAAVVSLSMPENPHGHV